MPQTRLNHSLIFKRVILYRVVNHKTRYYSIEINPTLFGEIQVTREYGGVHNKKSTGVIKEYFSDLENSFRAFESLVGLKLKRGYVFDKWLIELQN